MIRPARYEDLLGIEKLIFEFYEEYLKKYLSFEKKTVRHSVLDYLDKHIFLVDNELNGIIGGIIAPSIFDSNDIIAQESIWYVRKEYRGRLGIELLVAFEKECKIKGANIIDMINIADNDLEKLYTHRGYIPLERHYLRRL